MLKAMPFEVTERAIFARLSRRLGHEGLIIRKCRENSQWFEDLGRYYVIDSNNHLKHTHLDLEEFAREQECLSKQESLSA